MLYRFLGGLSLLFPQINIKVPQANHKKKDRQLRLSCSIFKKFIYDVVMFWHIYIIPCFAYINTK